MHYNYSKLLGAMKEHRITQVDLANAVGINPTSLSNKLLNKSQFKQSEMLAIMSELNISASDIEIYFFAHNL